MNPPTSASARGDKTLRSRNKSAKKSTRRAAKSGDPSKKTGLTKANTRLPSALGQMNSDSAETGKKKNKKNVGLHKRFEEASEELVTPTVAKSAGSATPDLDEGEGKKAPKDRNEKKSKFTSFSKDDVGALAKAVAKLIVTESGNPVSPGGDNRRFDSIKRKYSNTSGEPSQSNRGRSRKTITKSKKH
eukprot:IDg5452t1